MANRTTTLRGSVDPILTQLAQGYSNNAFVWDKILPPVTVTKATGQYPVFGTDHMKVYDTIRAPGSAAKTAQWTAQSMRSYGLTEYAIDYTYDTVEGEEASEIFDLEEHLTYTGTEVINLQIEAEVADKLQTTTNYASGMSTTLTGTSIWTNSASTPISDIRTGIEAVRGKIFRPANTMVLGHLAFLALQDHASFLARIQYSERGIVTTDLIKSLFGLDNVYVASSYYIAGTTNTPLWSDSCLLAYIPQSRAAARNKYEPSFGYTFVKNGLPEIRKWDEGDGLRHNIMARTRVDKHFTMVDSSDLSIAGYLIKDCYS